MKTYCDKEQVFYSKKHDNTLNKMNKNEDTESGKPLRNHDLVRKKSQEMKKLLMIEREISGSNELISVCKQQDIADFEALTHNDFNKSYETDLKTTPQIIKPIVKSRRRPIEERLNCSHLDELFKCDETKLN